MKINKTKQNKKNLSLNSNFLCLPSSFNIEIEIFIVTAWFMIKKKQ